jgi:hypothetical protein
VAAAPAAEAGLGRPGGPALARLLPGPQRTVQLVTPGTLLR